MKYFKLMYDYENDAEWIIGRVKQMEDIDEYILDEGKRISKWNGDICFEYKASEGEIFSDYLSNSWGWLLVSKKFQELLCNIVKDEIQYLPAKIINLESKEENTTYQIANVIDVVDALYLEHSVYDYFEIDGDKVLSVRKYALKRKNVMRHHIFRLKGDTIPIFVSEEVRNRVINAGLTGFDFLEIKVCD